MKAALVAVLLTALPMACFAQTVGKLPTELRGDYRFPPRVIRAADLGLRPKEVLSFLWHSEPESAPGGRARLVAQFDEKWTRYAIQGLANRAEPLVWHDHSVFGYKTELVWRAWYTDKHGFRFIDRGGSFDDFLRVFVPHFNGLVLYDAANSDNHFVAANIANANFCVPVSTALYQTHRASFGSARLVAYIARDRFPSRRAAYDWVLANCAPRLDLSCSYCPDARFPDNPMGPNGWPDYLIGADVAFKLKALIYNVSSLQAPSTLVAGGPNPEGTPLSGSSDDYGAFDAIMRRLHAPAMCYSWGTAEADQSRWGHSMVHTPGSCNLSFHAAVKPLVRLPFHQDDRPRVATPRRKVYLAFTSNEGDTLGLKCNLQWWGWPGSQVCDQLAQYRGAGTPKLDWSDHRPRCTVPRTWYLNPALVERFPAIFDYYFMTKTDSDYFACGPSGAGYVHMDFMTPEQIGAHVRSTAAVIRRTINLREVCLWGCNAQFAFDALADSLPGVRGILPKPSGAHGFGWLSRAGAHEVPVLSAGAAYYWMCRWGKIQGNHWDLDWKAITEYLNTLYETRPLPAYIEFYGLQNDIPDCLGELQKRLDPEKFEIVDLGTLMHLAGQTPPSSLGLKALPAGGGAPAARGWSQALWRDPANWEGLNGATASATERGIEVQLAPGSNWGLLRLKDVVLPPGSNQMNMSVTALSGGSWVIKIQDAYDAPNGPVADYIPFGEFPHLGRYATTLDPALQEIIRAGRPVRGISIGCSGVPGAQVVFEDLEFVRGQGMR